MVAKELLKHFWLSGHQSTVEVDLEGAEKCPGDDKLYEAVGLKVPLLPPKQTKSKKTEVVTDIMDPCFETQGRSLADLELKPAAPHGLRHTEITR